MSYPVEHHFFGPTSYRKARPASVSSSGFHSQRRRLTYSQPPSVDSLNTFNGDMTRKSEKELLQVLNDRFANYIDKVRNLEMHNRNLEEEAALLRQNQAGRSSIREHYERELSDLRGLLQELTGEKASAAMEHEHLEEDIQHLRARLEDEARNREELEAAARAMNKYVEECRLARLELDKKLRALEQEEVFLKKNHEEEVAELLAQIQSAQVTFDLRDTLKADLTGALREIRAQLDNHTSMSSTHAEDWFKVRIERLSNATKSNQDAIRGTQQEISEYRRQLQSCTIELETVRATKESLERQCTETVDKHQDDLNSLQETINQLDNELKTTRWEMANQLKDYQELLNVKMALDIEIAAYRKLLEGEENRFVSGGSLYSYLERRISGHFKVKGDEISDTVIVEEQTEETQVTEVTEEADEEEEEEEQKIDEEEAGAEDKETKKDEDVGEEEKEKEEEIVVKEEKVEKKGENEEIEKEKTPDKAATPPSKSPQTKSPAVKSPESKSPMAKSPTKSKSQPSKSPESKSPPKTPESKSPPKTPESKSPPKTPEAKSPPKTPEVKSPPKTPEVKSPPKTPEAKSPPKTPETKSPPKTPEAKSPPKTPETKSPAKEKPEPVVAKDTPKEEKQDKPQPVEKETKEKVQTTEEKKQEPKEEVTKTDKPDIKKESKADEAPKTIETPKAAAPSKPAEDKPAPKSGPKDSAPPPAEEKPSAPKPEKVESEAKPAPKAELEKTESKKEEDKRPAEKSIPKAKPENKKEEKIETSTDGSKEVREGGTADKPEKSSGTELKESKEEKAKK